MPRPSSALLAALLVAFVYGVLSLLVVRFQAGDVYPPGSTLRTDPEGGKALFEALGELPGLEVERFQGSPRGLAAVTDATLFFVEAHLADLLAMKTTLADSVDRAVRGGARAVVLLSDDEAASCVRPYCRFDSRPLCHRREDKDALVSSRPVPPPCEPARTAAGLWGFSVMGTPGWKGKESMGAELDAAAPGLPGSIPWQLPAYFGDLDPAFRVVYRTGGHPVVVERALGRGSVVLVAGSYLLRNEGLRAHRSAALLAWLVGPKRRVVFDETHLGVEERRGVVALARRHGLGGFFVGLLVLALLFVWRSRSPWSPPPGRPEGTARLEHPGSDGVGRLLRRTVPPARLVDVCLAEAAAGQGRENRRSERAPAPTRGAPRATDIVAAYNAVFREIERKAPRP